MKDYEVSGSRASDIAASIEAAITHGRLAPGTALANAYGHDVGIAEYVIGAMLAISRSFCRIDADLRRGRWDSVWSGAAVPPPENWPRRWHS